MMESNLYESPALYDSIINFVDDVPFYIEVSKMYGKEDVLELACGTGRLTIPLLEKGVRVTAIDNSILMLNEAKKKTSIKNLKSDYRLFDIRSFNLQKKFSLIILANNSISHLVEFLDIKNCFSAVYDHLTSEGYFIIDLINPSVDFLYRNKKSIHVKQLSNKQSIIESNKYNRKRQINQVKWKLNDKIGQLNMRIFFPMEIENYLKFCGFKIINKFGDFEKSKFNCNSNTLILICSKS